MTSSSQRSAAAGRHECRSYSLSAFLRARASTIHHLCKTVTRTPNQAQCAEHITQHKALCDVLSTKTFA
jgi:hypothetical protein